MNEFSNWKAVASAQPAAYCTKDTFASVTRQNWISDDLDSDKLTAPTELGLDLNLSANRHIWGGYYGGHFDNRDIFKK